ncbi:site-specific integrase [Komagataeibacter diospyri]|uniref:Tyr recombinase domain-containing protein n=1 Tax=Komagataeibacter diospyri TaxID=1932662 RepID=A0A4P5NTF9_9PROT|nr:hypothetical protein MSKU9_3191 [Komagataeibacter diospyri]
MPICTAARPGTRYAPIVPPYGPGASGLLAMPCPPWPARGKDVAAYLADMALQGRRTSTIDLHRAALRYLHHLAQIAVPTSHPMVIATLAGIRREAKEALPRQKTALTWDRQVRVVEAINPHDLVGARDRAILLLGFAGAFRRSELAALKVDDITMDEDGMQIRLGRSKGDPQRRGALIGIPRGLTRNCPVLAYETWLRQAGITEGPVFRRIWSARGHRAGATPVGVLPKIGPHALSCRIGRSRTSSANAAVTPTLRGTLVGTACAAAPSPQGQETDIP